MPFKGTILHLQVFEIWYCDRFGYKVSKNHCKQVVVSCWLADCEQSNRAATGTWKFHTSANFTTRTSVIPLFHVFRCEKSILAVKFGLNCHSLQENKLCSPYESIMRLSNGKIFCVTGSLCGEFTGHQWIPPTKSQWREALIFSLICAWKNGWVNSGNLRCLRPHFDVTVMH